MAGIFMPVSGGGMLERVAARRGRHLRPEAETAPGIGRRCVPLLARWRRAVEQDLPSTRSRRLLCPPAAAR